MQLIEREVKKRKEFCEEILFTSQPVAPLTWKKNLQKALLQSELFLNQLHEVSKSFLNSSLLLKPFIPNASLVQKNESSKQHKISISPRGNLTDLNNLIRYHVAIEYSLELLERHSLSVELLQKIHQKMTEDDPNSQRFHPGELRSSQVVLKNSKTNKIQYRPPLAEYLASYLMNHDLFLHDDSFPPLVHAGISHVQFVSIHPFYDGNGRIGNLLILLLLVVKNQFPHHLLSVGVFFIYSYFYSTVGAYSKAISQARKGYWSAWFIYFFDIISLVCSELASRINRIQYVIKKQYTVCSISSLTSIESKIIKQLLNTPFFTVHEMANELNMPSSQVHDAICQLKDRKILTVLTSSGRAVLYGCADIIQILSEPVEVVVRTHHEKE